MEDLLILFLQFICELVLQILAFGIVCRHIRIPKDVANDPGAVQKDWPFNGSKSTSTSLEVILPK